MTTSSTSRVLYWLLIAGVTTAILWYVASTWFPWLIQKFVALLIGLFVFVTGLFLRRRKSAS